MKHNLTVGQKLWYVPARRHEQPQEITITAVGRKWVQAGHDLRFDLERLWADGRNYSPPGRAYLSKEHYQAELDLSAAWKSFTEKFRYGGLLVPDGITIEDIARATELLFGRERP